MACAGITWGIYCGMGAVVIPILAACFPGVFLNERLESFLWRATGGSLLKYRTPLTRGASVQRHNIIPLIAFSFTALRATFLYYVPFQGFCGSRGRVSQPLMCTSSLGHIHAFS
jgi:hypothetical protein